MRRTGFAWILTVVLAFALAAPAVVGESTAEARSKRSKVTAKAKRAKAKAKRARRAKAKRAKAKRARRAKVKRAKAKRLRVRRAKAKRAKAKRAKAKRLRRRRLARKRRSSKYRRVRRCRKVRGKRRCRTIRIKKFQGHSVAKSALRKAPLAKPSGEIWIYAVNFQTEVQANIYDDHGDLDDAALAKLDNAFRCKRTGEKRAVNPKLYETLSVISDHFGKKRIELVSGFRNQHNQGSRHFHASAMDIRVPGVSTRALYNFVRTLDTGGMGIGIYPRSNFVHVDWRAPGSPSYRWTDHSGPGTSRIRAVRPSS